MPHASVRVTPGINTTETPALNEAGISSSNLIRFMPDTVLGGITQKLGGWTKFYPNTIAAIVRALWAFEDTNSQAHLALGTQNIGSSGQAQLAVITNNSLSDITPRDTADNIALAVATTSGSASVVITDTTTGNITNYDSVYIPAHISIGGIVLFGLYACDPDGYISATSYTVFSRDILGNLLPATSSSSSPVVAKFTTTNTTSTVSVLLPNHGYVVGSTYPVLIPTTVGGIAFYGNYIVQSVTDASNFVIIGTSTATSSTTGYINGGNAQYIYNFGVGAIPSGTGYGIGGYGSGGYGSGTAIVPSTGTPIGANNWTLDNWGQVLIACAIEPAETLSSTIAPYQPIYFWDSTAGAPTAEVIPQAPPFNDGIFIAMPQRQIVAWGSTFTGIPDPLLLRWCDVNNYGSWIALPTNQAGSFRLPKGSKIVGGLQVPQQALIWTDIGVWSMQYINLPLVYSFNEIGSGCGLIARKAAASYGGIVYWMGPSQFYSLTSTGVTPVQCPVWDVIFQNLDQTNLDKIRVAVNSRFGEVAWYYPTISSGGEVNAYVKYNTLLGQWDFGSLGRSAWVDQSVLGPPIGADPSTLYLYQHETSPDADGQPLLASFQTGYFAMAEGDLKTFVDQVWPDMKWGYYGGSQNATVNITFYVADYAGQTPTVYGPYSVTQSSTFFTPRFRGRLVSIGVASNDTGSWWRLGNIRYRYSPDGKF